MMPWFEIYYKDGSIFDSEKHTGNPPALNVQLIAQDDEDHDVIFEVGSDFYYWNEGRWWGTGWDGIFTIHLEWGVLKPKVGTLHQVLDLSGEWITVDIVGLLEYFRESGKVIFGRTVTNAEYNAIYQVAKRNKQAFRAGERRPE